MHKKRAPGQPTSGAFFMHRTAMFFYIAGGFVILRDIKRKNGGKINRSLQLRFL